ncbi:MAG: hypothetical protein U0893_12060 [Chloroflexota bacterium]
MQHTLVTDPDILTTPGMVTDPGRSSTARSSAISGKSGTMLLSTAIATTGQLQNDADRSDTGRWSCPAWVRDPVDIAAARRLGHADADPHGGSGGSATASGSSGQPSEERPHQPERHERLVDPDLGARSNVAVVRTEIGRSSPA